MFDHFVDSRPYRLGTKSKLKEVSVTKTFKNFRDVTILSQQCYKNVKLAASNVKVKVN